MANSINVGRAGEFLVAAELEQRGIRCHRVDMQDDDLWVKSASGELLTMQVKATIEPRADRRRKPCYMFTRVKRRCANICVCGSGYTIVYTARRANR